MAEEVDYEKVSFEDQELRKDCRGKWEESPSLRKEFSGDFGKFFAYEKNKGKTSLAGKQNVKRYKLNSEGEPEGFGKGKE